MRSEARRALIVDLVIAVVLAGAALLLVAGLGVAAFIAVPVLVILLLSLLVEQLVRGARGRRRRRHPAP